jgi:hypothetical protein
VWIELSTCLVLRIQIFWCPHRINILKKRTACFAQPAYCPYWNRYIGLWNGHFQGSRASNFQKIRPPPISNVFLRPWRKAKACLFAKLDCRSGNAKSTPEHLDKFYAMHRTNHTWTLNDAKSLTNFTPSVIQSCIQNGLWSDSPQYWNRPTAPSGSSNWYMIQRKQTRVFRNLEHICSPTVSNYHPWKTLRTKACHLGHESNWQHHNQGCIKWQPHNLEWFPEKKFICN